MAKKQRSIFSQYKVGNHLKTIQDGGESLTQENFKGDVFYFDDLGRVHTCKLGETKYGCDCSEHEILDSHTGLQVSTFSKQDFFYFVAADYEESKTRLPFIIKKKHGGDRDCVDGYFQPKYIAEVLLLHEQKNIDFMYYIGDTPLTFIRTSIELTSTESENNISVYVNGSEILHLASTFMPIETMTSSEDVSMQKVKASSQINEEPSIESEDADNETEEIEILDGATYKPVSIKDVIIELPTDDDQEPIGTDISSGTNFNEENKHYSVVKRILNEAIEKLRSSRHYVSKYATVRGGDDGTEFSQLMSFKSQSETDRKQIEFLNERIPNPYRYRVDLWKGNKLRTFYLGPVDIPELKGSYAVQSFYSLEGAKMINYQKADDEFNQQVELRREFRFERSQLRSYRNLPSRNKKADHKNKLSQIFRDNLTDNYLLEIMQMRRNDHAVQDIIVTIQENQNKIVDAPYEKNLIVQGCAGSGKTMVLMHRLSKLQNYSHAFDPKEVLLLTPSDQYSFYMKAITEGLAIRNIQQSSVESYYLDLLDEYGKGFKTEKKIVPDHIVNQDYVRYIYSDNFKEDFENCYKVSLSARNKYYDRIESLYKQVGLLITELYPSKVWEVPAYYSRLVSKIREYVTSTENAYLEAQGDLELVQKRKRDLETYVIQEAEDSLTKITRNAWKYAKETMDEIAEGHEQEEFIRELIETDISNLTNRDILLMLYRATQIIPSIIQEIRECEQADRLCSQLAKELREKDFVIAKAEQALLFAKQQRLNEYQVQQLEEMEKEVKDFQDYTFFRSIYDKTTEQMRHALNIKRPNGTHRYDLYAMLTFCKLYYQSKLITYKFICVDEGQDLALNEYRLIKDINEGHDNVNQVIFNVYGDINQLMYPARGIADWEVLKVINGNQVLFSLNENYRNTNQITEYCNNKFGMNVSKIGLNGPEISSESFDAFASNLNHTENIAGERWAILIPRSIKKKDFLKSFENSKLVTSTGIGNNVVALMYVDEVKGLEFERVYLFAENMGRNEHYIAATRALNELILVSAPDKTKIPSQIKLDDSIYSMLTSVNDLKIWNSKGESSTCDCCNDNAKLKYSGNISLVFVSGTDIQEETLQGKFCSSCGKKYILKSEIEQVISRIKRYSENTFVPPDSGLLELAQYKKVDNRYVECAASLNNIILWEKVGQDKYCTCGSDKVLKYSGVPLKIIYKGKILSFHTHGKVCPECRRGYVTRESLLENLQLRTMHL